MCIICAAIPATAVIGARLNADQIHREESRRLLVSKITAGVTRPFVIALAIYHTSPWEN
jgi:hypothetical protein